MPILKTAGKLIYYAHVPKCAGSSLERYLEARFGELAFLDSKFTAQPRAARWSKTSPQHINAEALERLFPHGFFDAAFTVVRHPEARIVSAFHFQREVEQTISMNTPFGEWLEDLLDAREEDPYLHDNHTRPMAEIVPAGAQVFHLEHGLDAIIPWFDALMGDEAGPRAIAKVNERGAYTKTGNDVALTDEDRAHIGEIFAADYARFGYTPDQKAPKAPAPELSAEFLAERDAALKSMNNPITKTMGKIRRKVGL